MWQGAHHRGRWPRLASLAITLRIAKELPLYPLCPPKLDSDNPALSKSGKDARKKTVGWPVRPAGRPGRASDKTPRHVPSFEKRGLARSDTSKSPRNRRAA